MHRTDEEQAINNLEQQLIRLDNLFAGQQRAFRQQRAPELKHRLVALSRLQELIKCNSDDLAAAVSEDFGNRSTFETRLLELFTCSDGIRHNLRHLAAWMRPERRKTSLWFQPAKNRILHQPLGVIGIVVPFNYPLYLAIAPLTAALAAGNRALIKMSEFTPSTAALLTRLLSEAFSEEEVAVISGPAAVAEAFTSLPFDHLFFTGSIPVGKKVMAAASRNLTPVTLELGGKSPAIIGPDADWSLAVKRIMIGKLWNAGQTCVAPDYLLLPAGEEQRFIEAAQKATRRFYPTISGNPDYSAIITPRHYQRLQALLADSEAQGAQLHPLHPEQPQAAEQGRQLPPMLLQGTTAEMRISQEEIFGPLLPLIPYRTLDEALNYINDRPRPLALYYFGRDRELTRRVLENTHSGGAAINNTLLHVAQEDMPFGGIGPSGMGHYHGREGFETFSKKKSVMYDSKFSTVPQLYPPYGKRAKLLLKWMMRGK